MIQTLHSHFSGLLFRLYIAVLGFMLGFFVFQGYLGDSLDLVGETPDRVSVTEVSPALAPLGAVQLGPRHIDMPRYGQVCPQGRFD